MSGSEGWRKNEPTIGKKQGPLVFNGMRMIAMTLFKQDTTRSARSANIIRKNKRAGLEDQYLSTLLASGFTMP